MASLDRPRSTDFTWVPASDGRQAEEERRTARTKLLALAGGVTDLNLRHRLLEAAPDRRPLLRVWNPRRQAVGETVACFKTGDGWEFHMHPSGPVLCSAEDVEEPGDTAEAAKLLSDRLAGQS